MLPSSSRTRRSILQYGYLVPFAAFALYGLTVLWGWRSGNLALVQPRSYDAALPANACACLILLGLTPIALGFGWKRTGLALGLIATVLAWATLIQGPLDADLGIDNLLVNHEAVSAGPNVARMPAALAAIFMVGGLLLTWLGARPGATRRPILLALLGSLCAAYGLTGLLGYRIGLHDVEFWQTYARLGPHTALALIVLGLALIYLATRDNPDGLGAGPRWLWLPVVVCSVAVTFTFWIALRQRELTYTNSTTQLTINNIASLFSRESESTIQSLSRQARRWTGSPDLTPAQWEKETAEYLRDFEGYRSISWVDSGLRTRWYWPRTGNEDAPHLDHTDNPVRRAAVEAARRTLDFAVAAPLESPLQSPSFAVYFPVLHDGSEIGRASCRERV